MPKSKPPLPRKSHETPAPDVDALAQALADLALAASEGTPAAQAAMVKALRQALRKKQDEVLYGAIELARFTDADACRHLRSAIEESAATLQVRKEGTPAREIDAFMVPLFVRSQGGLRLEESFQDDAAFDALVASFTSAGLESSQARVVLMRHAYDLDQIDRIAFGDLHDMLREAASSMLDKKLAPAPALERSMQAGMASAFAPDDEAMELRFLLGFSLKLADDPFYLPPADEAGADAFFGARMDRYQDWTRTAAPLVQRCLATDSDRVALNFLYQDLFFGAKEQGIAELGILSAISELNEALAQAGFTAALTEAVIAPVDDGDAIVLRIQLYANATAPIATVDKPTELVADLQAEIDELADALEAFGFARVSTADGFGDDGAPIGEIPFALAD